MYYPYPENKYVHYMDRWSIYPEDLSDKQKIFLFKLNSQLSEIEKNIKNEVMELMEIANKKISDRNEWFDDYEIDCYITFILKDDDPYFKDDDDNVLVQLWEFGKTSGSWSRGIGDNNNHNEFQHWNHPMCREHHCWLYHCLYDHTGMGWVNILRIGSICIDINIEYQKNIDVV